MVRVRVGVVSGMTEEKYNGKILQSDRNGITASWLAIDGESGVKAYQVCVGTSSGEWHCFKREDHHENKTIANFTYAGLYKMYCQWWQHCTSGPEQYLKLT
jgi:hypothetical protein